MAQVNTYTVVVTREDDQWLADVPNVPGAHTFARSLPGLIRAVREVIVLMDDEANLPEDARVPLALEFPDNALLAEANELARERRDLAEREARNQRATADEAAKLTTAGYSVRDAAEVLGISPGRVSQLVH